MQILEEISRKECVRKEEVVTRREPGRTSAYPLMHDLESALAEQMGKTRSEAEEESNNGEGQSEPSNPYNVPVTRKFLGIPGVPKKGLGYRLSESELLQNLQDQMKSKEDKKSQEKQLKLQEEKRYIDHINMEIDFAAYTKQLTAYNKKKELMRAWSREAFLKKMQKLKAKGDIEGLRSHKKLNTIGAAGLAGAEGDEDAISTSRSSSKFSSIGFDSRK